MDKAFTVRDGLTQSFLDQLPTGCEPQGNVRPVIGGDKNQFLIPKENGRAERYRGSIPRDIYVKLVGNCAHQQQCPLGGLNDCPLAWKPTLIG